eukprot:GHVQ01002817.1.p1 GENE.GHVQ01002817.1~~GHVQ01002817.1.p1  ORF type:complete len:727 (+),score=123.12 GHVQ01002817.1:466-2646(+)
MDIMMSNNRISDSGVDALFRVLIKFKMRCGVVKLFKNCITDAGLEHIKRFIDKSRWALRELHLSHNRLTETGALSLARAIHKNPLYPRKCGNRLVPMWLRLEHNDIKDSKTVIRCLKKEGIDVCTDQDRTKCGPQKCRHSTTSYAPPIHLYMLDFQNDGHATHKPHTPVASRTKPAPAPAPSPPPPQRITARPAPWSNLTQQQPSSLNRPTSPPPSAALRKPNATTSPSSSSPSSAITSTSRRSSAGGKTAAAKGGVVGGKAGSLGGSGDGPAAVTRPPPLKGVWGARLSTEAWGGGGDANKLKGAEEEKRVERVEGGEKESCVGIACDNNRDRSEEGVSLGGGSVGSRCRFEKAMGVVGSGGGSQEDTFADDVGPEMTGDFINGVFCETPPPLTGTTSQPYSTITTHTTQPIQATLTMHCTNVKEPLGVSGWGFGCEDEDSDSDDGEMPLAAARQTPNAWNRQYLPTHPTTPVDDLVGGGQVVERVAPDIGGCVRQSCVGIGGMAQVVIEKPNLRCDSPVTCVGGEYPVTPSTTSSRISGESSNIKSYSDVLNNLSFRFKGNKSVDSLQKSLSAEESLQQLEQQKPVLKQSNSPPTRCRPPPPPCHPPPPARWGCLPEVMNVNGRLATQRARCLEVEDVFTQQLNYLQNGYMDYINRMYCGGGGGSSANMHIQQPVSTDIYQCLNGSAGKEGKGLSGDGGEVESLRLLLRSVSASLSYRCSRNEA